MMTSLYDYISAELSLSLRVCVGQTAEELGKRVTSSSSMNDVMEGAMYVQVCHMIRDSRTNKTIVVR